MLARYNRVANERLYEQCGKLELAEYRRERPGSFGSIHALLNHMLLGDRIWMSRFAGGGNTTPPLNTILFETFAELSAARIEQDAGIESFFEKVDDGFVSRTLRYRNSQGKDCVEFRTARCASFLQSPDASSGPGARDAQPNRCAAAFA